MADSPFVGPSYPLSSRYGSVARTINLMPVPLEPGNERVGWALKDVEGLGRVDRTIIIPPAPSAWNPLDLISGQSVLPPGFALTEANRVGTRQTATDAWETGVRGELSHGGTVGEHWYLELEVVSTGAPGNTQNMQVGMVDGLATNVLSRPPDSNTSEITNIVSPNANFVLCNSRTVDGVVFSSEPDFPPTAAGDFGSGPVAGDIYSFEWLVGTSITVRRNNVSDLVIPFLYTGQLFPYFSAGDTLNGPDTVGTGESCRIRTGKKQQMYVRAGATPWG